MLILDAITAVSDLKEVLVKQMEKLEDVEENEEAWGKLYIEKEDVCVD